MAKLKTGRHTGAIKSQRQAERRALMNKATRKRARAAAKAFLASVAASDKNKAKSLLPEAASTWDKAAKSGAIHWKTAARRKARLSAQLDKLAAAK
ncbi:MAG TPA: 30S ribosomal protein S20 [Elusimicrobiota bacterium]|jgi:small subunit ribosomal protein S20|nr:30S ribosomal protein S20 [Elusimicrobiota bacterium]